jgi:hypothetical protein
VVDLAAGESPDFFRSVLEEEKPGRDADDAQ